MDLKTYQERASKTAIFPNEKAMEYLALGMTSEATDLESIMFANLSKLEGRQKRNTLHGEGDHR